MFGRFRLANPDAPKLAYASFKNITTYAKKQVDPLQPKNLREMAESLQQEQYAGMLKYNWRTSSQLSAELLEATDSKDGSISASILFADGEWIRHVLSYKEKSVDLFVDGTFSIKPAKLRSIQVYKIETVCFCRGIPLAYAAMERRTSNDYEAMIRCFVDKFAPQLRSFEVKVHCDFEKGEEVG